MDLAEISLLLKRCEFFKGLQEGDIRAIANMCRVKAYATGEHIFRQGDLGNRIYVVAEGHVHLERSVDLGSRQGSAVIGLIRKGRVFGCWSTLLDEKHTLMSSAICRKPTKVVMIKGSELRQMMRNNNEVGFHILESLCFLLRDRLKGVFQAMEEI
jgi:CRP/FNR family cyclic AMP-dependent transcriptional regulator